MTSNPRSAQGSRAEGPLAEPESTSDADVGVSGIVLTESSEEARYLYISESIEDILGYRPRELLGKSCYDIIHPDEKPLILRSHHQTMTDQRLACVMHLRLLHRQGHYVPCCLSFSYIHDKAISLLSRKQDGPMRIQQELTARDVIEFEPQSDGTVTQRHWTGRQPGQPAPPSPLPIPLSTTELAWQALPSSNPRTAFVLDRFTETSRVMLVTNDVILNSASLKSQPFYSIVKPSDRPKVRRHIEAAKEWSPVRYDEDRTGGHGYASFQVLKIPDLPPQGERLPLGTDESERHMPGQDFIPVDAIFTAASDGVLCIIERVVAKEEHLSE